MNIGDIFGGGVVFYVDETGENGLIAKNFWPNSVGFEWDHGHNLLINTGQLIGHGKSNTETILSSQPYIIGYGPYAAWVCDQEGWYLPSIQELRLLCAYRNLPGIDYIHAGYWSSSCYTTDKAHLVDFSDVEPGAVKQGLKFLPFRVIAVKTFGSFEPFDISTLNLPITPDAPNVFINDSVNTVSGMLPGMEYNLNGAGWVAYNEAVFNSIDFSGNNTLLVRVAAQGINFPGHVTTLTFTANQPPVDPPAERKDVSAELRRGYITKLTGLQLSEVAIPVYDTFAPTLAPDKYILIRDITDQEVSTKDTFVYDCAVTVDIVTKFSSSQTAGSLASEQIANEATKLICPKLTSGYVQADGFKVVTTKRETNRPMNSDDGTTKEFRRILIFRHILVQV